MSPNPACHDDGGPAPSSLTSIRRPSPSGSASLTVMLVAPECRAAFVMASVTIRYAATSTTAAAQVPRTGSGPRAGLARTALAILMPIGPLAIAVVRGILPYNTTGSSTVMAAKVAGHQGTETIVIWLTFVALPTLIPGVIALGMLARRHAPRLGTAGLVLAYAAFACLPVPRAPR